MTRATPDAGAPNPLPGLADALAQHFARCPIGICLLDGERRIVAANAGFAEATGVKPALVTGSPLRRFLVSDMTGALEREIFDAVARDGRWLGEVDLRSSIGGTSPMLLSVTAVDGTVGAVRFVGTVAELGDRRWIESESERRARDLATFSQIAVATGSSTDPLEMLSTAARQVVQGMDVDACWIHRYDPREPGITLVGEASYLDPSVEVPPALVPSAGNPAVHRALETRELVEERGKLDRSIARILHLPLLARGDVVGVLSILSIAGEQISAHDADLLRAVSYQIGTALQNVRLVESVRESEAELQEKNDQLQRMVEDLQAADRMKSEFLANTSHELRTPLNSVIGFLDLVLDGLVVDEAERLELLRHASRSSRQLLDLINDVLDLSRIEAGKLGLEFEEVALAEVLAGVGATMRVQALRKGLALEIAPPSPGLRVLADAARIRQVLLNVVGNAVKFTQRGGVTIRVEEPEGAPWVDVIVHDTGVGIPAGRRDFLFQKFSQADTSTTRKFGGTGLGLVIVKELIEAMGGSVRVESPGENRGTTVTLTFARSGAACAAPAPGGAEATAGTGAPADAGF